MLLVSSNKVFVFKRMKVKSLNEKLWKLFFDIFDQIKECYTSIYSEMLAMTRSRIDLSQAGPKHQQAFWNSS